MRVEEGEVRTDEREHSEARWCDWEEVQRLRLSSTMEKVMME